MAGIPTRERPHVGRAVLAAVLIAFGVFVIQGLFRNANFDWPVFKRYFFSHMVLDGLLRTIELTGASIALALVVALVIANMRLSSNPVVRGFGYVYVWFFRSIPLLVLLILGFNFSVIYPRLSLGVPFGPKWFTFSSQELLTAFTAAVLAFGLQQAAYTSETIRAALLAVPAGQREAAASLGMSYATMQRRIVLPQAMKIAVPPIGNDVINMLKGTSLVAFISVPDLLYSVQLIYSRTYQIVPLLMVACIWYMVCVTALTGLQYLIERRLGQTRRHRYRHPRTFGMPPMNREGADA